MSAYSVTSRRAGSCGAWSRPRLFESRWGAKLIAEKACRATGREFKVVGPDGEVSFELADAGTVLRYENGKKTELRLAGAA